MGGLLTVGRYCTAGQYVKDLGFSINVLKAYHYSKKMQGRKQKEIWFLAKIAHATFESYKLYFSQIV